MNEIIIEKNEKFKTMYGVEGKEWKYGYLVYAQLYGGKIYVTFYKKDFTEKIHFNGSGSIDISMYGKAHMFLEMLDTAKMLGWLS